MVDTRIIDGKAIAAKVREQIAQQIKDKKVTPGLAVILVGENPASIIYANGKQKAAKEVGVEVELHKLSAMTPEKTVMDLIDALNKRPEIHGVLLQMPLPPHLNAQALIERISPDKDVDGLHPVNVGKMTSDLPAFVPGTPLGCLYLLKTVVPDMAGKRAVVVGRSALVGRPLAHLLLRENCTVTQAHSKTQDLSSVCKEADILVSAVGKPGLITKDHIKRGAIVIDVGINRLEDGKIVGDVLALDAQGLASYLTPVPGGVGPMTIAMLLLNTLKAACFKSKDSTQIIPFGG